MNTGRVPVVIKVDGFFSEARKVVNTLRGFPDGFCLKKYPTQASCEKASPGIMEAQRRAEFAAQEIFKAELEIDENGNIIAIHSKQLSSLIKE